MFLQNKYENAFQKDAVFIPFTFFSAYQRTTFGETTGFQHFKRPEFKSRHPIVGSTKLSRLNFERTEQVFPKEDTPFQAVEAKVKMTQLVDPDILGLRKKDWNNSTAVSKNHQEEDFERKLTKVY